MYGAEITINGSQVSKKIPEYIILKERGRNKVKEGIEIRILQRTLEKSKRNMQMWRRKKKLSKWETK